MLDIVYIRNNPGVLDNSLKNRNKAPIEKELLSLDEKYRSLLTKLQKNQEERNSISAEFGKAKSKGEEVGDLQVKIEALKKEMADVTEEVNVAKKEFFDLMHSIPNMPSEQCPVGADEEANVEVRRVGEPPKFDFKPLEHYELGEKLGLMDFERATKMAGSRFDTLTARRAT